MRAFMTSRTVGVVGACGLVVIAGMLLVGELTLTESARRAAFLLGGILVLEHLVLPVARALVGEPALAKVGAEGEGDSLDRVP